MAFDDIIPANQGSIKSSEIFMDRSLEIIKNSIGETTLKTLEGMMKPISDALRYNNFLLYSDGQIIWETVLSQPRIRFDADGKANNIRLRLMMLDEAAVSRTVDIIIPATTGANSLTAFNTINMNNNDLIYMELSRATILAAISGTPGTTPATILLENGIDGGSVTSGQRLLKVNMTANTGMPAMVADLDSILQDSSQTVNIPIASRYDWSDGVSTLSDVWWIPHGIRWPTGSLSAIGGVVVSGFNALPNYFARTIVELVQQLALLTTTGGTIAVIAPITVNSPLTVPAGATIIGRTNKNDNTSPGLYFSSGGRLIMGDRSALKNLYIRGLAGFGQSGNEDIVTIASAGVVIEETFFEFVSGTSTLARAINFQTGAQDFRVSKNLFTSISSSTRALQFSAASYTRANLASNQFTTITEANYTTPSTSMQTNNSYGVVPVGTILPWIGAAMVDAANSTPTRLVGSMATLASMLPEGWVICDGRALPVDSPLIQGGASFTPNLTDRYLLGSNSLNSGVVGGSFNYATDTANVNWNSVNAVVTASASFPKSNMNTNQANHTHSLGSHVHAAGTLCVRFNTDSGDLHYSAANGTGLGGWNSTQTITGTNTANIARSSSQQVFGTADPAVGNTGNGQAVWDGTLCAVTVSSGATNKNQWNSDQIAHSHSVTGIRPTYLNAIYIMRYK